MRDFFISFSSADRSWAEWIAWQLQDEGYTVELQGWTWGAGASFPLQMDRAIRETRRTLLVLSPDFLHSAYAAAEWAAAFREDPKGLQGRLVPIKVRPCEPDGLLGSLVWIDLIDRRDEAEARNALIDGLKPPGPPSEPPGFPGGRADRSRAPGLKRPAFPGALPEHWNVPHLRNPHFTGREDLLRQLRDALHADGAAALTQAIAGLGGVGKTELALEFAYRHAADYDLVWWVRAEDPETLVRDYAGLAGELGLSDADEPDPQADVRAARRWLEMNGRWLLIFDNAEDPPALHHYLPRGRTGPVLITSRRKDWDDVATPFEISVLPPEDAVRFLLERTGEGDKEAAGTLAEELGHLPLALEQAGAYVHATPTLTLAGYLELFRERRRELLAREAPVHHEAVDTTWELSFRKLEQDCPKAADLLRLLCFFAPEDVPLELFTAPAAGEGGRSHEHLPEALRERLREPLPESLASASADPIRWHGVENAAWRLSLLEFDAGAVTVHRLVQAVLRDRLTGDQERLWAEAAVTLLLARYGYDEDDPATWPAALRLLPHVAAATAAAEVLGVAQEATCQLLNEAGIHLHRRRTLERAYDHLERALAIGEQAYGAEHPEVAGFASNLGMLLQERGELDRAEELTRRALAIDESAHGAEHPKVATRLSNLGLILKTRGDLATAEELTRKALAIDETAYGPDHPNVAIRASNLGLILEERGDLDRAETVTRRALAIDEKFYGPEHPNVGTRKGNLGLILKERGDLDRAEELTREALAIDEKVYGPDYSAVAIRASNLGQILKARGDLDDAEELTRRALAIGERVYGSEHPQVATFSNNLGQVLQAREDLAGAEEAIRKALRIGETVYGPEHPQVAAFANNLGQVLLARGDFAGAARLTRRALAIGEAVYGPEHPQMASFTNNLAAILQRRGDASRAEAEYRRALAIAESTLGTGHPTTRAIADNLANV